MFPQSEEQTAIDIAYCESNMQNIQSRSVYSKDHPEWGVKKGDTELSFGIFQVHIPVHPKYDREKLMTSIPYSIEAGYEIWLKNGWKGGWRNCLARVEKQRLESQKPHKITLFQPI